IGDYYAACMDEAAIEKRGLAPLAERLAEVEALASKQAIAGWLGRSLPAAPSGLLFTYSSAQDYKHASDEIAEIDQGGLGLPDRDYYLKKDPRSLKLREDYRKHVEAMLGLTGLPPASAAGGAKTVLRIETALADASQSRVDRRNPD